MTDFGAQYDYPTQKEPSSKPVLVWDPENPLRFIDLIDTFADYSGKSGQFLKVKTSEDGITVETIAVIGDQNYIHVQPGASNDWGTINHGMGKKPCVDIFDNSGNPAHAIVTHIDDDNLTITSSVAFAGTAIMN